MLAPDAPLNNVWAVASEHPYIYIASLCIAIASELASSVVVCLLWIYELALD